MYRAISEICLFYINIWIIFSDISSSFQGHHIFRPGMMQIMKLSPAKNNTAQSFRNELECGPMPNVMAALPNRGGTPTTAVPCSNAAKTRKPLKLAGVPQTNELISAASGPKFTVLWGHVEDIFLLNKFFSDCRYVP